MDDKVNILIADDLPDKLLVLETILADLGQNVIAARSGEEALRLVLTHQFAVILLDVNMPGMNGLETAALIRRRKKSAHVPIIFITAFDDEMHVAEGYSLGAVDYVRSPLVPEILCTKVKVFVDLFRMTEQVRRSADERVALAEEQAARSAAEEATRRSAFLAEASASLASSLEFDATVRNLARSVVPFLADLGAVTLTDSNQIRSTELAWAGAPACRHAGTPGVAGPDNSLPQALQGAIQQAITTARTGFVDDLGRARSGVEGSFPANGRPGPNPPRVLQSAVVLPLRARGQTIGVLTLGLGPSGRRFGAAELALAEDFAGRAAVALDNARLYQDLQEANRRKNEFLSMLAHELRNPLAPIRNAVHVLRQGALDPAEMGWAHDVIDRQVQHLARLVDDLLDISRITRGKIRLQMEPIEVAAFVGRAVETSRPLIDSRRHRLVVELPREPLWVKGDLTRLSQVLSNLLNNAAKYTPEGGQIWLTVHSELGTRNSECGTKNSSALPVPSSEFREVVLCVRDTGVGIPAGMLQSVFDLFTQVERSLDRSEGGLGIGLTLVRRLVEMHGGRVQASSPGPLPDLSGRPSGSEFTVRLPLLDLPQRTQRTQGEDKALSSSVSSVVSLPQRLSHVLVVDDNKDAADSLAILLRLWGHETAVALDGPTALELATTFQPETVLLDIGLPGMDGYEVARRLRQRTDLPQLLLIAVTGYGQQEDQKRSREAGIDHHLVKPIEARKLQLLLAAPRPTQAALSVTR